MIADPSRRRHLRSAGRKVLASVARGRWRGLAARDHWVNFRNLLWPSAAARAECPICGYRGPFLQFAGRPRQICPRCDGRSRHRVIHLALERWRERHGLSYDRGLHVAPEPCLTGLLEAYGGQLWTGDLQPGVGQTALDLRSLPLADGSLDFVLASHVLEHVLEDRSALAEILRVLRPGGLAVLIVPITAERTVEFGAVVAERNYHARDCGPDYFDRYREAGFEVEVVRSDDLPGVGRFALTSQMPGGECLHWIPFCRKPPAGIGATRRTAAT